MDLLKLFDENRDRYVAEWCEWLRFPSVSALPEYDRDCENCAAWLVEHLRGIGLRAELLPTPYKPVVYAEHTGAPGRPTVLYYGHYDVQPVDPLDQWISPPFEPALRDGRVYARGAQDNKGQVFAVVKALETLLRHEALRCNFKVLIEGEEESGSRGITQSLESWRKRIGADFLMVSDTGMAENGAPAVIMGLRGIVSFSLMLRGPAHDLHSGLHGGVAPNPAAGMARLIASLHRPDGAIAVENYYRDVIPPSEQEKALAAEVPFDDDAYRAATGVEPAAGEPGYTPAERVGFRPSIDVNGFHSGFGGRGGKTIIPAEAQAKISARLCAGQDPEWCCDSILRHLRERVPAGLRLDVEDVSIGGPGFRLDPGSPAVGRARAVLDGLTAKKSVLLWEGASVPVVAALAKVSGAEPLLVGFGREGDRIHAPNESYSLEQFRLGFLYAARFLAAL